MKGFFKGFPIIIRIFLAVKISFDLQGRILKKIGQIGLDLLELCAYQHILRFIFILRICKIKNWLPKVIFPFLLGTLIRTLLETQIRSLLGILILNFTAWNFHSPVSISSLKNSSQVKGPDLQVLTCQCFFKRMKIDPYCLMMWFFQLQCSNRFCRPWLFVR